MGTHHSPSAPDELTTWMQAATESDRDATGLPWRTVAVLAGLLALAAILI